MKDEEIDAILRENRMRRVRARRPARAAADDPEAHTPLLAIQKKLGVKLGARHEGEDLALVLAAHELSPERTRTVIVSRRHRKVIGERG
jgi:hypothetical protein